MPRRSFLSLPAGVCSIRSDILRLLRPLISPKFLRNTTQCGDAQGMRDTLQLGVVNRDGSEGPSLIDYSVMHKSRLSPALLLMAQLKTSTSMRAEAGEPMWCRP